MAQAYTCVSMRLHWFSVTGEHRLGKSKLTGTVRK